MTKALFLPLALILAVLTTVAEAAPFRPSPALEPAPMVTLTGSRVFTTILSKVEQSAPRMPLSLARLARGEQSTPSAGRSTEVCLDAVMGLLPA